MSQKDKDQTIRERHQQASVLWLKIEATIDDLKALGPHSLDGDNALMNVQERLNQLSKR
jgi:hypothetical protein